VLPLLLQGKPNKPIGRALGIGEGTVKVHLAAVFRVLNVRIRTEAVVAAQALAEAPVRIGTLGDWESAPLICYRSRRCGIPKAPRRRKYPLSAACSAKSRC
jgi:hypothetical protein